MHILLSMSTNVLPSATAAVLAALLDYNATQEYLGGLSRSTLKALATNGEIRVVHIGRRTMFRRDDLDAFIARKSRAVPE
jgi:excisionase family DNA binding protein